MKTPWFRLPSWIAERRDLTGSHKVMYAVLRNCARLDTRHWPGVRTLAGLAGQTRHTAQRAIVALAAVGLVDVTSRGPCRSAHYVVYDYFDVTGRMCQPVAGAILAPVGGAGIAPVGGAELAPAGGADFAPLRSEVPESERERERQGFLPLALRFQERMRKEKYTRITDRQLWQVQPAFAAGVPFDLAYDLALDHWLSEPPWEFCQRAIREWESIHQAVETCHQAYGHKAGAFPPKQMRERIAAYCDPDVVLYARGERHGIAGEAGEGGGQAEAPESRC